MADGHKTPSELVDYMIKVGIDKRQQNPYSN